VLTLTKTMRVLVVDDEQAVCRSVEKILMRKGHTVEKTQTAGDAIRALQANPAFDIILADLMMPQVSGLDLLRMAHGRWPAIPIVIMTGYASIASAIEATRAGAIGYLPKPFTPDELEAAIERTFIVMTPHASARPVAKAAPKQIPAPVRVPAPVPVQHANDFIDVDMPFSPAEVAAATSAGYVQHLTRSDMSVIDFCDLGQRTCKRLKAKGICTQPECPMVVSERRKTAPVVVSSAVGDQIDVDMPFSFAEVAAVTSQAYAGALGRGDMAVTGRWNPNKATGRKVLVVDDEPVVASSMRRTLNRRGFQVDEAFSGNDALNRILNQMYDLVLLDMRMPDSSGLELLPTIKKHRPKLPVVMVTGYASIDTAVEAIQRGASDYMAKPFTPDELYATANRAIRGAAA
jgi:DNA-binding response OmpR family regulator